MDELHQLNNETIEILLELVKNDRVLILEYKYYIR